MEKNKIVLNIPHSSTNGLTSAFSKWTFNPHFINNSVRKMTDWYTDILFTCSNKFDTAVIFDLSRFCVDVERLENDELEGVGQGILYTEFNGFKRNELTEDDVEYFVGKYKAHIHKLTTSLEENAILVDCHSFSGNDGDADICVGFNDDWSYDSDIINIIIGEFNQSGYSVSLNKPYSNSIAPKCDFNYKAVMIEVNKKVYMNESTLQLNNNDRQWMRWQGCLDRIYEKLANYQFT